MRVLARGRIHLVAACLLVLGVYLGATSPAAGAVNVAPVCQSFERTVDAGQPITLQADCSDADNGPSNLTYSIVATPTNGTVQITGGDSVSYMSSSTFSGDDQLAYRAFDGSDYSNTAIVTIHVTGTANPVNLAPACPASQAFVPAGGSVDVRGNCTDPEGDPIGYGLVSFPTGGSLQILSLDSVRYTPSPGTTQDSFVFSASDGHHAPLNVTFNITVTDPGPGTYASSGSEASPSDPYTVSVTTTQGGAVTMDERSVTSLPPSGFFLFNQEFDITAPDALSADDPLRLLFTLDSSILPTDPVTVFRNGSPIADCSGPAGSASPDPCIESGLLDGNGDLKITVLSTHASIWNFGVATAQPAYAFTGFFAPVNNRPDLNLAKAGSSIPVKFGLGGDQGLGVFAAGYPKSQPIDCGDSADLDGIEATATAGASGLSYDPVADRYTYVWKTSKDWTGCRQLVLKFNDPAQSTYRANFSFKAK
jgi:hypothetical protein